MSDTKEFIDYQPPRLTSDEMTRRAGEFEALMSTRRSVRTFSADPVPRGLIESAIRTAGSAPSGANRQPWMFVAISDPAVKREIRIGAEEEERKLYEGGRLTEEWRNALEPLGTDWRKPYLEVVPWIVVVFEQLFQESTDAAPVKNYYVKESVGIACGMFVAAIHAMGLSTLTHTPSPMAFLNTILDRPKSERPFALFPIGYPATDCTVPKITRKPLAEISAWKTEAAT